MQNTRILGVVQTGEYVSEITLERFFDGEILTREMPMSPNSFFEGLEDWLGEGKMIQNAFPGLSANDREFLMTGITPEEWSKMFGEEE